MASLSRRNRESPLSGSYWPGFVDAMATLVLVIVFLLAIFMLAQFFLAQEVTNKDTTLDRLRSQISELSQLLALERVAKEDLQSEIAALTASLTSAEAEGARLQAIIDESEGAGDTAAGLRQELDEERRITAEALAQVELMNQQLNALRRQLAALEEALEAAEAKDIEAQAQIADLGRRLNAALAQKVQELARARSEFFAALREALGNRADIEVVGDRFVLPSEILFESGSDQVNEAGSRELAKVGAVLKEIGNQIPDDVNWVLRVDGHTDAAPINTLEFPSNWHLSTARAISVVEFLVEQGIRPERLMAAGFGEFQPLQPGEDVESYRRNRRIEFKLTER